MEVRGAEALVEISDGRVVKKRQSKNYRHPELDTRIRKDRNRREARNLKRARKYGVNVPEVVEEEEYSIEMREIDGRTVKEILPDNLEPLKNLGENVARLHSSEAVHGDLTTSNALWNGEKVFLVDFGLSDTTSRTEDRAVDLHLFKQVLESSHTEVAEAAWKTFIEGYSGFKESDKVLEHLEEVEKRGRYK